MKITRLAALAAPILLAGLPLLKARPRPARQDNLQAEVQTSSEVRFEDHHDTSPPLRDMAERAPKPQWNPTQPVRVIPLRPRPGAPFNSSQPDSVLQETAPAGPLVPTANFTSFDGVPNVNGVVPPDPNASVGATQVVETVNIAYQVFSKTGASLLGPININTLWSNFGGGCQTN